MKKIKKLLIFALSILLCLHPPFSICSSSASENDDIDSSLFLESVQKMINEYGMVEESLNSSINKSTNRVIVKTNSNTKIDLLNSVEAVEGFNNLHILQFETSQDAKDAIEFYNNQDYVKYAEEDIMFNESSKNSYGSPPTFDSIPTLDDYGCVMVNSKATLDKLNGNYNLPEVIVAIFDSGIAESHPYFDYSRILCDGKFLGNSNINDRCGHGTHVAGIIYNNTPSNVKLRPYKVTDDNGRGSLLLIALNIYVAVDKGADIINISLGRMSGILTYLTYAESVSYAKEKNVPVVVAAGNEFKMLTSESPAIVYNCITVSSVDEFSCPSEFSNYGNAVDIAAPGEKINSTLPYNNKIEEANTLCNNHYYATVSGTSMSTPFVSSAIAILLSIDPTLTVSEIETTLKQTATVPENWDSSYGAGIVDFSEMITLIKTIPPQITASNNTVVISAPEAKIYFTTDGTDPIINESNLYSGEPINISGIKTVKAIAVAEGQPPSNIVSFDVNRLENIEIRYKGRKTIKSLYKIEKYYCSNDEIVSFDGKQIKGESIGKATVTIFYETGQMVTYKVTVDFAPFQWFHEIIYKLFGVLLWSL